MNKLQKDWDYTLDEKKNNPKFQRSHFQCIFNYFGFLVCINPKINEQIFMKCINVGRVWPKREVFTF